jgi:DNA-binding YbaB/EbfC family protein
MFQGLGSLTSLWKQAGQLGGQLEKLGEELRKRHTTGISGGGMVEVEINGALEVLRCKLDPQLMAQGDRELIEDLVVAAVNQAIGKAKQLHADSLKDLTGGLQLPGIREALEKISGAGPKEP